MSTITPPTTTPASAASTAPTGISRARATLVSVFLSLGSLAVAITVLWQPWGARNHLGYADIAPHRDAAWLGTLIDGLGFAAVGITLGLAVCILTPKRGSALANVGAVLTGLGGLAFGAGMISYGSLAWYATSTAALPVDAGTNLMTYAGQHPEHVLGAQMAGFLLVTIGALVLMGALWRARAVPRWLPLAYLVLTVGVFAVDGVVLNVVQAVQTLSLLVVAFYAQRAVAATR